MQSAGYDASNIFCKIINKTVAADIVFENEEVLAFHDSFPKAPVHILVIPKGQYTDYSHFMDNATNREILSFFQAIYSITLQQNLSNGYRLVSNKGKDALQEVPHFHVHLMGGKVLEEPLLTVRSPEGIQAVSLSCKSSPISNSQDTSPRK